MIQKLARNWLLEGERRNHTDATLTNHELALDKLSWFLDKRGHETCGADEIRGFLAYVNTGHTEEGGRWGNANLKKKAAPLTALTYHRRLRAFFRFLVDEGILESSPMEGMKPPVARPDQIQPFTPAQVQALLAAARKSPSPHRDTALCLFLLDTGCRATEVCGIRMSDLDIAGRHCTIRGKGKKARQVYFGRESMRAILRYLKGEDRKDGDPLFLSEGGHTPGQALTRNGLYLFVRRLGRAAKLEACRCSPHTFRHTFAVEFLRGGGSVFSLQQMLGHESLSMTNRYVSLAAADIEAQHRLYSPGDRLNRR